MKVVRNESSTEWKDYIFIYIVNWSYAGQNFCDTSDTVINNHMT